MNLLFYLLGLVWALLAPLANSYTANVVLDSNVINAVTGYTFTFESLADNDPKTVTLTFPSTSDISSTILSVIINSAITLPNTSYSVNSTAKTITVTSQTPLSNTLVIKVTNIVNPPSVEQFTFETLIPAPQVAPSTFPFVNYQSGALLSCIWKFNNFTGSTNSNVDIDVILGNRLLPGNSEIEIRFPNLYEDSDTKFLTMTTPTLNYSIDGGSSYFTPLPSPAPVITPTRIRFSVSIPSGLAASSLFRIRLIGIVNPPTQNPSGINFIVQTFDSFGRAIDKISQCTINPLNVLELIDTFDNTSLNVNDPYRTPKITVNSLIPFTIFKDDVLQLDHNEAMSITSLMTPSISITRGSPFFIVFNPDTTQPITATTRFFRGNMNNTNEASATSQIQLRFDIRAPPSQKPWQFVVTLSRRSGAYVRIRATMQAYAISINSTKVSIGAATTEMAMQSQYTLNVVLQRAISKNGKLMLGFNPDYDIKTGGCVGFNGGAQITSTATCQFVSKNGYKWLSYKIGQNTTNILDLGTSLMIQFSSSSIKNPLYPNNYTYRLEVYYTEFNDSLVAKAQIFGSITMTKHISFKASLLNPDFTVYELAALTISYTNQVYIPQNSILEFILPPGVISFDFIGKITINSLDVLNATLDKSFPGGLTGRVTVKQDIAPSTVWGIPLMVKTPIICGDYPSITFKVMKSGVTYQEVTSGLNIKVKKPSAELSAVIEPKTNNQVDAITDYTIRIQSRVPLATQFYVIVTLPVQVRLNAASTCSATNGICSKIQNPSPNVLNLTLINSVYTTSNTSQDFTFVVNQFINPRFQGATSTWKVQLKGMFNNILSDISEGFTISSNFRVSTRTVCELDPTKSYYRSNTDPVLIKCAFVSDLIQGDYIIFGIISNAYTLNHGITFSCTSPLLSSIRCVNSYSSTTTIIVNVTILTTFTFNKNLLTLQIAGLISNPDTTYDSLPVYLEVKRFNALKKPIDQGIFPYDISCNDNATIKASQCKTCLNDKCVSCYTSMYLSSIGVCVKDCPIDTQFRSLNNPTSLICQPCTPPCYTCENSSTTCLTCITSSTFYLYRNSRTCQTTCDTANSRWINTVDIPGTRICDSCLAECLKCVNNTLVGCLECQSGYVLEGGFCRLGCLDPTSYDRNGVCVPCNFACDTCNGSGSNNCIQCRELYYMNNGFCVSTCPLNKYTLPNGTCGCQSNCATCTSSSPTFCMSCLSEQNLLYNGSCLKSCPPYTMNSSTQCVECPKNCIQCFNTATCQKCGPGFLIYQSACYGDCNSISYQFDKKGDTCVLCPTGCDTCSDSICMSCLLGYAKKEDQCVRECMLTNSCDKPSPVPDSITPVPATIAFVVWVGIVYIAKFFNPKIYPPYSIVFLTSALEYFLIIGTTIYSSNLVSESARRLLEYDLTQRPIILNLLIVALVVNYVMNIIFAFIFFKYLVPLINAPRQVDYITIGAAFIIGMITNYRFCLIFFSKMFPKPRINVEFSSRLTPVHYLCIASVFLSGFALGACGIILKNEYPLTDIFMLAIDILIIEVILILFSVWMVAVDKSPDYFDDEKKVYHLEDNYRTQENVMQDDKNTTKNHLNIRDQFDEHQHNNTLDDTNTKKLLGAGATTVINVSSLNLPESQNEKPLEKRQNRMDIDKIRMTNKIENSFDTDISDLNKLARNKKALKNQLNDSNNQMLKPKEKQNLVEYDKKNTKAIFDSKKFQTSDEQNNMPKVIDHEHPNNDIMVDVQEPQSDEIPNLPITNSIFHERSSSEFGQRIKTRKSLNRSEQKSEIIKNKSPLKSPTKGKDIDYSQAESKSMMKKKNKFFDSEIDNEIPQRDKAVEDFDIEKIIKDKIVVIERKDTKDEKMSMGEANNISSIEKREDENSEFNDEVSPSWFNIQNQRFDISSVNSDFSENN